MPLYELVATSTCLTLGNFGDLLSIAFGINLALPVFRELVIFNGRNIATELPALQSIIEERHYQELDQKKGHLRALYSAKVAAAACEQALSKEITICAYITFSFSMYALILLFLSVFYKQNINYIGVFTFLFLPFIPFPLSYIFLSLSSRRKYKKVRGDLQKLKAEIM